MDAENGSDLRGDSFVNTPDIWYHGQLPAQSSDLPDQDPTKQPSSEEAEESLDYHM